MVFVFLRTVVVQYLYAYCSSISHSDSLHGLRERRCQKIKLCMSLCSLSNPCEKNNGTNWNDSIDSRQAVRLPLGHTDAIIFGKKNIDWSLILRALESSCLGGGKKNVLFSILSSQESESHRITIFVCLFRKRFTPFFCRSIPYRWLLYHSYSNFNSRNKATQLHCCYYYCYRYASYYEKQIRTVVEKVCFIRGIDNLLGLPHCVRLCLHQNPKATPRRSPSPRRSKTSPAKTINFNVHQHHYPQK